MSKRRLVCITERRLVHGDFLERIDAIAAMHPRAIVLREKDLSFCSYLTLADAVRSICRKHRVYCILNWREPTLRLAHCGVQLSFERRNALPIAMPCGVSVHSADEASLLQNHPARWLFAGHVFPTTCKPNQAPRGLTFLEDVVAAAHQPVYAIGGITPAHVPLVRAAGAAGYCVRSPLMESNDVQALINEYYAYEGD